MKRFFCGSRPKPRGAWETLLCRFRRLFSLKIRASRFRPDGPWHPFFGSKNLLVFPRFFWNTLFAFSDPKLKRSFGISPFNLDFFHFVQQFVFFCRKFTEFFQLKNVFIGQKNQ